jgi:hypothetical protein
VRGEDFEAVAAHPEIAAGEGGIIALVLQGDELADDSRWSTLSPTLMSKIIAE